LAYGSVQLVRHRMTLLGRPPEQIVQATALELPFAAASFEYVYSIGCLHHTGDLSRAVAEVHRVLRPGGYAVVMLYNHHSLRRLARRAARGTHGRLAGGHDANLAGERPP